MGLAIALAYGAGMVTGVVGIKAESPGRGEVLAEAVDEIARNAAHPVSREELEHAAIKGMLDALDDQWARYYPPKRYKSFQSSLVGRHADQRASRSQRRESVPASPVSVRQVAGDVLVVDVANFSSGVGRQVRKAVLGPSSQHDGGIILDLRGNPGGLLREAVRTASVFLDGGVVVSYEGRGSARHVRRAAGPSDTTTPLAVLVDGASASAAEVVAGALQDRDRAVIIGSRTLGKGTVQRAYQLSDGSAVKLTIGRYYTPSGRNLGERGIVPDVYVDPDRSPKVAVHRARQVLSGLVAMADSEHERGTADVTR